MDELYTEKYATAEEIEAIDERVKDLVDNVTVGDDWPTFNNSKVDPNIFEFDIAERLMLTEPFAGTLPLVKGIDCVKVSPETVVSTTTLLAAKAG